MGQLGFAQFRHGIPGELGAEQPEEAGRRENNDAASARILAGVGEPGTDFVSEASLPFFELVPGGHAVRRSPGSRTSDRAAPLGAAREHRTPMFMLGFMSVFHGLALFKVQLAAGRSLTRKERRATAVGSDDPVLSVFHGVLLLLTSLCIGERPVIHR